MIPCYVIPSSFVHLLFTAGPAHQSEHLFPQRVPVSPWICGATVAFGLSDSLPIQKGDRMVK